MKLSFKVKLPQFGMGMQDGAISRWLRAVGESVAEGDDLVEVEAAKTVVTVEAPVTGVLAEILAAEGQEVQVGDVIAIIQA